MFDYTKTEQVGIKKETLSPHPDGKAWPKCCRDIASDPGLTRGAIISCAFIHDQQFGARLTKDNGSNFQSYDERERKSRVKETPFMCVHRTTEDGHHRVCAGWDACFGNKAIVSRR